MIATGLTECDAFTVGSRKWQICRGEAGLPARKTNAYRVAWGLEPLTIEEPKPAAEPAEPGVPELIFHGHSASEDGESIRHKLYGPGTELLKSYEAAGVPSCDACKELAQKMNNWGVDECRQRLDEIVADIMPRAKEWAKEQYPWVPRLLLGAVEDWAIDQRLRADVTKAIDEADRTIRERRAQRLNIFTGQKIKGCSSCGSAKPVQRRAGTTRHRSAFAMGSGPVRFITLEQYTADVRKLLTLVPHDIDAVAGVARSGLYPASMIAMWLHKPMYTVSQAQGVIAEAGNGWRLANGPKHVSPQPRKVLVVDDTVMTGSSQRILRNVIGDRFEEAIFATVYCNPFANIAKPDIHAVDLEWPHLLEWNLFNSVLTPSTATDFDGILCHDCRPADDDDGPRYLEFLRNARPLYQMRRTPIPLIVTARLEKYRSETLAWLQRQGMRCDKLVMGPWRNNRERARADIGEWKAGHFKAWTRTRRGLRPLLFIESDARQAQRIAEVSRELVVCPAAGRVFQHG